VAAPPFLVDGYTAGSDIAAFEACDAVVAIYAHSVSHFVHESLLQCQRVGHDDDTVDC
jgi:hypothetical protein